MRRTFHNLLLLMALACFSILNADRATAQEAPSKNLITVEILLPRITGSPVQAQKWGKALQQLGYSSRIRQPLPGDEPDVTEQSRGTFRNIKIVGRLERDGSVSFPQKKFTLNQTDVLKAWLDEIQVYGAQGSPKGKKFWGLNKLQFDSVVDGLSASVETDTLDQPLMETVDSLPIDDRFPIVVHPNSREAFFKIEAERLPQNLKGITSGTALAAMLHEFGFGFQPLRTPQGTIEISIQSLSQLKEPWPIGWDIDETKTRQSIAPNLYGFVKTGFDDVSLQRVLDEISTQTKTPILVDYAFCVKKGVNLTESRVSFPQKQTAWSLVLASVLKQTNTPKNQTILTHKLMLDEAGTPFVWVTPFVPYKLNEE